MKNKKKGVGKRMKLKKLSAKEYISIFCLLLLPYAIPMKPVIAILVRGLLILPTLFMLVCWSRSGELGRGSLFGILPLLTYAFLPIFLSSRLFLLIWLLLFLILLCYMLLPFAVPREEEKKSAWDQLPSLMLVALFMMLGLLRADRGTYVGNGALILFLISLALSAVLSVILLAKVLPMIKGIGVKIVAFLLSVFFLSLMTSLLSMTANYALDFHEPVSYDVVIEEKKYERGGRKTPGHYEFGVVVNGEEIEVKIPVSHYNAYEVGDTYTIYYYQGAFGVPFYIAENR